MGALRLRGLCGVCASRDGGGLGNTGAGYGSFVSTAVDRDSIVAVAGLPYTLGAWFRYRFATSVDCSPPRGCYAQYPNSLRYSPHVNPWPPH